MDDLTTEHSFDSQATWVIDVFGLFAKCVIHGCLYNQALADVRPTVVGIKCIVLRHQKNQDGSHFGIHTRSKSYQDLKTG